MVENEGPLLRKKKGGFFVGLGGGDLWERGRSVRRVRERAAAEAIASALDWKWNLTPLAAIAKLWARSVSGPGGMEGAGLPRFSAGRDGYCGFGEKKSIVPERL